MSTQDDEAQRKALELALDEILALIAQGVPAKQAIAIVVAAMKAAEEDAEPDS
jgi:uncharacterized protein YoaH (UPF0181 family)